MCSPVGMLWMVRCLGIDMNALLYKHSNYSLSNRSAFCVAKGSAQRNTIHQIGRFQLSGFMLQYEELSLCHKSVCLHLGWVTILF
jgi:hypothetical protein